MGNAESQEKKQEQRILRRPQQGEASEFYWACKNGNFQSVHRLFSTTNFNDINRLEPNGSTGLHAASYFGHVEVVQYLLRNGVFRHRTNRYGSTAYEEAQSDEIRELFHRPSDSQRFSAKITDDSQHLFAFPEQEQCLDDDYEIPNGWISGVNDEAGIRFDQAVINLVKTTIKSPILRRLIMRMMRDPDDPDLLENEKQAIQRLQRLIDEYVTPSHLQYKKACELLSKYDRSRDVSHLLRLYSMETPFYKNLGTHSENQPLLLPLFAKLNTLRKRAFQGCSYRGLTMTQKDLRAYRWAFKHKGSVIGTNSFCSTSIEKEVASRFITGVSEDQTVVLMVFNFAEKCDTAIQLFTLSKDLPGISEFEEEREVLILPMTFFRATKIEIDKTTGQHIIYLENFLPRGGLFTALKAAWDINKSD